MTDTTAAATNGADAIVTEAGNKLHFYRPIASLQGKVMKYAGEASPNNMLYFPQQCMQEEDGYLPGLLILPVYVADRIVTATLMPFVA